MHKFLMEYCIPVQGTLALLCSVNQFFTPSPFNAVIAALLATTAIGCCVYVVKNLNNEAKQTRKQQ